MTSASAATITAFESLKKSRLSVCPLSVGRQVIQIVINSLLDIKADAEPIISGERARNAGDDLLVLDSVKTRCFCAGR
jgi:hypothetical protein